MRLLRPAAVLACLALVLWGCGDGRATGPDDPSEDAVDDGADVAEGPADDPDPDATTPDVPPLHPEVDGWDAAVVTITRADGEQVRVDVRLATTNEQRQRGLMHVEEVPEGAGMLFVYEEEREGAFWMKNTLVPLDIAYAGLDGDIRSIMTMEPCEADPCPTYDPGEMFGLALEVPAGWFADHGVAEGDELDVSEPVPAD